MSKHKPFNRLLAMVLSACLVLGMTPAAAAAEIQPEETGGEIISFEALSEETANREVPLGTSLKDLNLPGTLNATVRVVVETDEEEPVQDSGEPEQATAPDQQGGNADSDDAVSGNDIPADELEPAVATPSDAQENQPVEDGEQLAGGDTGPDEPVQATTGSAVTLGESGTQDEPKQSADPEFMEMNIPVPVEWVSAPDYDADKAGVYTFTVQIKGFTVRADLPQISVTVGTPAGVVTAFAPLADEIRWQSVEFGTAWEDLNLPGTLPATVEGETADVSVTWESAPAYDANTKGLYLFTAQLDEGWSAMAELPHIAVVVRAEEPRFILFGFGGGAQSTDPFLIGTAAQLAEIAALTNMRLLEATFLGTTSGMVYLKLDNDIDLSGVDPNGDGSGWVPIGGYRMEPYSDFSFKGSFDGGGHVVTGLNINREADVQGLFGSIASGAQIKNLGLLDIDIAGKRSVGGIVGSLNNKSKIQNCYVTGSIKGNELVGGIAGSAHGIIESCYSTSAVSGNMMVGGIAGEASLQSDKNRPTIKNCAALNPSVTASASKVGRVAGLVDSGSTLSGNIAFGGMTVNGSTVSGGTAIDKDGATKSAAEIIADNFFETLFSNDTAWTYETGKLPGFGAAVEMPAHIVDGTDPNFRGEGTEANPYQISTPEQLAKLAELVNASNADYNNKYYKLMNGLDLSGYASGEGWMPIGTWNHSFYGRFDGAGHVITGLVINRPQESDYQGLFGAISFGVVENLGLDGVSITGTSSVGGVSGYVRGTVQNCYTTGVVTGTSRNVGGVAGAVAYDEGKIESCYSTAAVSGENLVGGVAGYVAVDTASLQNCIALNPSVTATATNAGIGRVIGLQGKGTFSGNIAFSGMTVMVNGSPKSGVGNTGNHMDGLGKTSAELQTIVGFPSGFNASPWTYTAGKLPSLGGTAVDMPAHLLPADAIPFEGTGASTSDPYLIKTAADLVRLAELVNAENNFEDNHFRLENNLDLSGIDPNGDNTGWVPIGQKIDGSYNRFYGSFDGGGHVITGLTINRPGSGYQGLFGYAYEATISNLGIVDADITGGYSVGGVVGYIAYGSVNRCYVTGAVSGEGYVGGVAGYVLGTVQNCYSTGAVSGEGYVGGVAGYVEDSVENCYATGAVRGSDGSENIGGVAGFVYGTVQNCAALNPSVSGTSDVGRVAGYVHNNATLNNNYAYAGMECESKGDFYNNGTELTSAMLFGENFWTTDDNWDTAGEATAWSETIWEFDDGKLPLLKGTDGNVMPGQSGAPDLYLLNLSTDELTVTLSGEDVITGGSGTAYTALASYTVQTVNVTVNGWEDWIDPRVTITAKKLVGDDVIVVTPSTNGSGTFEIPEKFSGNITVTAQSDSNPNNKTEVTLTVSKRDLSLADFQIDGSNRTTIYNGEAQALIYNIPSIGESTVALKYNGTANDPTNAGTYAVTADVTVAAVYNDVTNLALGNFTISPKPLTIINVSAAPRAYNGTTSVELVGSMMEPLLNGLADRDIIDVNSVGFTLGNGTIENANAGDGKAVTTNIQLTGTAAGNYTLNQPTGIIVDIAKKALTTASATVLNKEYDGNTNATVTSVNFTGLVEGETLLLGTDYIVTGKFHDANVKTGKLVAVTPTLLNTDISNNYSLSDTQYHEFADITKKAISGTVSINVTQGVSGDESKIDKGDTLTADISGIEPSDPTLSYQWYRNGTAISGETASTYTVAARATDPAGSLITVKVTGTGNYTGDKTSAAVEIGRIPLEGSVSIDGTPNLSYTLTLNTALLTPSGATTSVQWLRDGTPISGAIGNNYAITKADLGKSISVSVTGTGEYSGTKTAEISVPAVVPEAPTNFSAAAGNGQLTLNWTAPFDGGSALTKYQLSKDGGASWQDIGVVTTFTVTELTNGTEYTIKLRAVNSVGEGAQASATGKPVAPRPDSDGGNGGGGSYTPTTPISPAKQPNQPTTATASATATAGKNGSANAVVPEKTIADAITKAQATANAQGKTANGIGVSVNVTVPANTKSLGLVLTQPVLKQLTDAKVQQFEVNGQLLTLGFNQQALAEIQKQSTGDVTITIKPVTVKGVRNAYDITISYVKDGKTVGITSLGNGSVTLSIPCAPAKGEAIGYLYAVHVDAKGKLNRIAGSAYDTNSRSIIFSTDHFSVYGVGYEAPSAKFSDIGSHWAKESIDYVIGRGLFGGNAEGKFKPDTAITRGDFVTALGRLSGVDTKAYTKSSFTDVKAGSYYLPYIEWAYSKGIIQGIGNSQFAPERAITRQEIAVILQNYAKATGYTLPVTRTATTYADASGIGSAYKTAVTAMQQAGIMMGETNNKFNPTGNTTRAEASAMLHRYIKLTIDPDTAQGWAKNDDGQYFYYKDGKPVTKTQTIDGVKYFFNDNGSLKTGWVKDDTGNWRFYSGNTLLVGWWDIGANGNNKRYYFDTYGNMISGKWLQIDGKWYYFYADGSLAKSTKIDGYEVDENGVRKTK